MTKTAQAASLTRTVCCLWVDFTIYSMSLFLKPLLLLLHHIEGSIEGLHDLDVSNHKITISVLR